MKRHVFLVAVEVEVPDEIEMPGRGQVERWLHGRLNRTSFRRVVPQVMTGRGPGVGAGQVPYLPNGSREPHIHQWWIAEDSRHDRSTIEWFPSAQFNEPLPEELPRPWEESNPLPSGEVDETVDWEDGLIEQVEVRNDLLQASRPTLNLGDLVDEHAARRIRDARASIPGFDAGVEHTRRREVPEFTGVFIESPLPRTMEWVSVDEDHAPVEPVTFTFNVASLRVTPIEDSGDSEE